MTLPLTLPLTLLQLFRCVNSANRHVGGVIHSTIEQASQIGHWLIAAKETVRQQFGHGHWQQVANEYCEVKERERRYYMAVAKNPDKAKRVNSLHQFARYGLEIGKCASQERRKEYIAEAVAALGLCSENWQVHHADNREFDWPMVDHIWTDPPWPDTPEKLEHYSWLAELAETKLKDGGLLAVQCGPADIIKVGSLFKEFTPIHTLAIVFRQACNVVAYSFLGSWKPVLLFSKGKPCVQGPVTDTITVSKRVKLYHPWQQPLDPFVHWLPALTKPGDLVADPFGCTATIALACKMTGRRCISTEIEWEMVAVALKRLADCDEGQNMG